MKIRELITVFGFKVDSKALERLDARVSSLKGQMLGISAVGIGAAAALFGIAKATANAGDEARDAAMRLGITAEAYQELAYAASLSGASIGDVGMGIKRLSTLMENAKTKGGAAADTLRKFGLDPKQQIASDKALEQIADRFAALPNGTQKAALAVELFGRSGMQLIPLLNEGSAGIRRMRLEAVDLGGVISNETADAADAFNDSLEALTFAGKGLVYTIGAELLPVMTEAMGGMIDWWKANRKVVAVKVREWTQRLIVVLKAAGEVAKRWSKRASDMVEAMGGLESVAKKVAIAFALAFGAKMLANIVGIAEALAVLSKGMGVIAAGLGIAGGTAALLIAGFAANLAIYVLLWQDFITAMTGGDSVIGRVFDKFRGGKALLAEFSTVFVRSFDLVAATLRAVGAAVNVVLGLFGVDLSGVIDKVGAGAKWLAEVAIADVTKQFRTLNAVLQFLVDLMTGLPALIDRAGASLTRMRDNAAGILGTGLQFAVNPVGAAGARGMFDAPEVSYAKQASAALGGMMGRLMPPSPSPLAAGGTTISAGDIQVNVPANAGSPEAVGQSVRAGVNAALEDAARRSRRNYAAGEE